MVKDPEYLERTKRIWLAEQNLSLEKKFEILDALYGEARSLGKFGEDDLLLGLDHDVRLAANLNANVSIPSR